MALFSSTPKKSTATKSKKTVNPGTSPAKAKALSYEDGRLSTVLKAPHFSEKAFIASSKNVYVFKVTPEATKPQISAAIEKFYSVTPTKVRIVNLPAKVTSLRTRRGQGKKAAIHKAYVTLKQGDSINLI